MRDRNYLMYKVYLAEASVEVESNEELYRYVRAMSPAIIDHSKGVAKIALLMGMELKLKKKDIIRLGMAGLVHDVGKIFISSLILYKDGNLTDEEFEVIKEHPNVGAKLLERLGIDPLVVEMTAQHHERLDGSGYPYHLERDEIGYLSQILSLADIYDALRHKRCYKAELSGKEAIEELRNTDGLNPQLVNTLEELVNKYRL